MNTKMEVEAQTDGSMNLYCRCGRKGKPEERLGRTEIYCKRHGWIATIRLVGELV